MKPTILFIHQNYPAQFGRIANYMAANGWNVFYATAREEVERNKFRNIDGVQVIGYEAHREPSDSVHVYLRECEKAFVNGQAFANLGVKMKDIGINPDVVVAHSGWGGGGFAKAVWPDAKYVQYLEWWYVYPSRDCPPVKKEQEAHTRAQYIGRNMCLLFDFQSADAVWCPTEFQSADFPDYIMRKTRVAFDGVDTEFLKPRKFDQDIELNKIKIAKDELILTYATRGMEPARGFPQFMEALSKLQKRRSDFRAVIAGEDTIHYSKSLPEGETYKKIALREHEFDHDRISWTGRLIYPKYRDLLTRSNVHVYLTRPFVTSWSFFEAAAAAAPMIVSDSENTREILPSDRMAKYVNAFEDNDALVDAMDWMLDHQAEAREYGENARARIVSKYSKQDLYPKHVDFFRDVIEGRFPDDKTLTSISDLEN